MTHERFTELTKIVEWLKHESFMSHEWLPLDMWIVSVNHEWLMHGSWMTQPMKAMHHKYIMNDSLRTDEWHITHILDSWVIQISKMTHEWLSMLMTHVTACDSHAHVKTHDCMSHEWCNHDSCMTHQWLDRSRHGCIMNDSWAVSYTHLTLPTILRV